MILKKLTGVIMTPLPGGIHTCCCCPLFIFSSPRCSMILCDQYVSYFYSDRACSSKDQSILLGTTIAHLMMSSTTRTLFLSKEKVLRLQPNHNFSFQENLLYGQKCIFCYQIKRMIIHVEALLYGVDQIVEVGGLITIL